jgi:hypothetical protein
MDVALLDCGFPEALRRVYKKGWRGSGCLLPFRASENPKLLKTLARSPALLVPLHRSSGPRQANRASPPTVRSDVVFFLICCKCVADRFVVQRYLERFGGGGVTAGPHGRVWRFEDFLGLRVGYVAVGVFWEQCWARPGGGGDSRARGRISRVYGVLHRWPSPSCASLHGGGPAEV